MTLHLLLPPILVQKFKIILSVLIEIKILNFNYFLNFSNNFPHDRYAAEYMVDHNFYELLETGSPLLCIKDKKVLIEFSTIMMPMNYEEIIFKLRVAGYTPIIAHPERYLYLSGNVNNEKCILD